MDTSTGGKRRVLEKSCGAKRAESTRGRKFARKGVGLPYDWPGWVDRSIWFGNAVTYFALPLPNACSILVTTFVPINVDALHDELHDAENPLKNSWRTENLEPWFNDFVLGDSFLAV